MKKRTKIAAVALAASLACTVLSGCVFTSTNTLKDYRQVIAEVDITQGKDFQEGGAFAAYSDVIEPGVVTKQDMVAMFVSSGYSMIQNNYTYYDTFNLISDTLVNRQIYLQYAMAYFMEYGDAEGTEYSVEGYRAAIEGKEGEDKRLAGLKYFLAEEEVAQADYSVRVLFNNSIDALEESLIAAEEEESPATDSVRTLPNGVETENEDYYDAAYKVYTGSNSLSDCGSYEAPEGSTVTTRRTAYNQFLGNLRSSQMVETGEDVSDAENLSYFKIEQRSAYEMALLNKLGEKFEAEIKAEITEADVREAYDKAYTEQSKNFADDRESFETALDSMSDTSFILTAPEENYGFVINILLPFSQRQTNALESAPADSQGNKFGYRATLLSKVRATDQRSGWFTGETDYSFDGSQIEGVYTGGNADRTYLFFEDSISGEENGKYERLENYYGRYTFNGSVSKNAKDEYVINPARLTIDDFIAELEGYLNAQSGLSAQGAYYADGTAQSFGGYESNDAYYAQTQFYKDDAAHSVDYSKFVYYQGKVAFGKTFDPNQMFVADTPENKAFSAINELSFAYNTDTAGLNSYLGYAVSVEKTDFVSEFEYAAQLACKEGAGSYVVVPSDYGWHIIYCTFSFVENGSGEIEPFAFDWDEKDTEGTFSNLYYESICANATTRYTTIRQSYIINEYTQCATVYKDRYADLTGLDLV